MASEQSQKLEPSEIRRRLVRARKHFQKEFKEHRDPGLVGVVNFLYNHMLQVLPGTDPLMVTIDQQLGLAKAAAEKGDLYPPSSVDWLFDQCIGVLDEVRKSRGGRGEPPEDPRFRVRPPTNGQPMAKARPSRLARNQHMLLQASPPAAGARYAGWARPT